MGQIAAPIIAAAGLAKSFSDSNRAAKTQKRVEAQQASALAQQERASMEQKLKLQQELADRKRAMFSGRFGRRSLFSNLETGIVQASNRDVLG